MSLSVCNLEPDLSVALLGVIIKTVRYVLTIFLLSVTCQSHPASGTVAGFLLEITWPQEGTHSVYLQRPFELRIIPRDSDGDAIDTLLRVRLTARFPGEFDAVSRGYFQFPFEINGPTSIMLTPSFARDSAREQQWLRLYCESEADIDGRSEPFSVLPHAPVPFTLIWPPPRGAVEVMYFDQSITARFLWEKPSPPDPYAGMRRTISSSSLCSDSVRYTLVIENEHGTTILRLPSDSGGALPRATVANSHLITLIRSVCTNCRRVDLRWYVEASDGTAVTISSPARSDFILAWEIYDGVSPDADAADFSLEPNSPNPFRSRTQIPFTLSRPDMIRLTLVSILGETVRVLAEGERLPGSHLQTLNSGNLTPGPYFIRLETTSGAQVRKTLLLR